MGVFCPTKYVCTMKHFSVFGHDALRHIFCADGLAHKGSSFDLPHGAASYLLMPASLSPGEVIDLDLDLRS